MPDLSAVSVPEHHLPLPADTRQQLVQDYADSIDTLVRTCDKPQLYFDAVQVTSFPKLTLKQRAAAFQLFLAEHCWEKRQVPSLIAIVNTLVEFKGKFERLTSTFGKVFEEVMSAKPERLPSIVSKEFSEAFVQKLAIPGYRSEHESENRRNFKMVHTHVFRIYAKSSKSIEELKESKLETAEDMKAMFPSMFFDVSFLYLERRKLQDVTLIHPNLSFPDVLPNNDQLVTVYPDEEDPRYVWQLCQSLWKFKNHQFEWNIDLVYSSNAILGAHDLEFLKSQLTKNDGGESDVEELEREKEAENEIKQQ
jgi:hypothetical protein